MAAALVASVALILGEFGFPLTPDSYPDRFPYDDGSWVMPLEQKEQVLREMMLRDHNIMGLYPSQLTLVNGSSNLTTLGHADVSHSIHWTSMLLVGEIHRWKVTRDPSAFERVKEVFDALIRCHRINQVDGVLSRGYIYGHGPSYEERRGHGRTQDRWWQGEGEFAGLRWRGNPSHHNYSSFMVGMGAAWVLIDDPEMKRIIRDTVEPIIQRVYIDNDFMVVDHDGEVTGSLFGGRGKNQTAPSMRSLFVTTALKIGADVTGRADVAQMYEDLVTQMDYRGWATRPAEELAATITKYHDDADQSFHHLHTMTHLEDDEDLLKFYRNFAEALWLIHGDERQPPFNALYHLITGNDPKASDIRWWLDHYPTNKVFQPRHNSYRVARGERLDLPLALNERPFDNEYDFKADPMRLDGWASRFITDVAVSPIDPMIVFAVDDAGYMYRSNDGGETWADCHQGLSAKASAVLPSSETLEVVLAATDRGVLRSRDFGYSWVPVLEGKGLALAHDPTRQGVAYALTEHGFFESVPFDNISWGFTWRTSGGDGPPWPVRERFLVATGDAVRFLAQDERNSIWGSGPGQDAWTLLDRPFAGRFELTGFSGSGNHLLALTPNAPAVAFSNNGGTSWAPRGGRIYWWGAPGESFDEDTVVAVALDPTDPEVFYVAVPSGFWVSRNAGQSWERAETGMDIPVVGAIATCPHTGRVFAGSRGGLVWSDDQGRTWERGNLVAQFHGSTRMQTGPADFMVAYWLSRYIGAITEEQLRTPWGE